jgi:hypothetical protein
MRLEELREKVRLWDSQNTRGESVAISEYTSLLNHLEYFAENNWGGYLPAFVPRYNSDYMVRLAKWVGNVTDDSEQMLLLEYALYISFFSHDDFLALYQTAFNREVLPWLVNQKGLTFTNLKSHIAFQSCVNNLAKSHTWYCPITDSMDINEFYKTNHISGISHKPHFASLFAQVSNPSIPNPGGVDFWKHYLNQPNSNNQSPRTLDYIVLLEDIVGSGSQCLETVRWAVNTFDKPVLFIPLILCPNGLDAFRSEEAKSNGKLTVRPIVKLERSDVLGPERKGVNGWGISNALEDLAIKYARKVHPNADPFGYRTTGSSISTFSNTPDNSLPLIHQDYPSLNWNPLFPRVFRD